jgi:hypothetical protein
MEQLIHELAVPSCRRVTSAGRRRLIRIAAFGAERHALVAVQRPDCVPHLRAALQDLDIEADAQRALGVDYLAVGRKLIEVHQVGRDLRVVARDSADVGLEASDVSGP